MSSLTSFDVEDLVVRFGDVQSEPPPPVSAIPIQVKAPAGLLPDGGASRRVIVARHGRGDAAWTSM